MREKQRARRKEKERKQTRTRAQAKERNTKPQPTFTETGPNVEANLAKSRSPHSQRQGQQHQLNQRERTIKRGEHQTEGRDQKKG